MSRVRRSQRHKLEVFWMNPGHPRQPRDSTEFTQGARQDGQYPPESHSIVGKNGLADKILGLEK